MARIGVLLGVLGALVGAGIILVAVLLREPATIGATRVPVGAARTVALPAGHLVVYVEVPRVREDDNRQASSFDVTVEIRREGGEPLPVRTYGAPVSFDTRGGHAFAKGTIDVPTAGDYRVAPSGDGRTVVLGRSGVVAKLLTGIFAGAAVIIVSFLGGGALVRIGRGGRVRPG